MRAFETEKTEVAEIDRSVYDIKDKVNAAFELQPIWRVVVPILSLVLK